MNSKEFDAMMDELRLVEDKATRQADAVEKSAGEFSPQHNKWLNFRNHLREAIEEIS